MLSRRDVFQWVGMGAVASLATRCGFAAESNDSNKGSEPRKPKHGYELGLADYTLHKFPLDKALPMAKRVGLLNFCIHPIHLPPNSKPEQIKDAVAKVKAAGLNLYACGVIYMKTADEVNQAFAFAKTAGIRLIVGVPMPELLPLANENVQKYDIRLAIHNHGPEDKVYPSPEVPYLKIKDLDPRLGLCIDIGHTLRSGMDPSDAAERFADRLFDVHIKDIHVAARNGRGIEVGRGVIDIPKFLRTLDKVGYTGKVSFEYEKDMSDPLIGLAESVGYVRGAMAAI
jgi:sugar phosphate isomerase/epimerase